MNGVNYQKELDKILEKLQADRGMEDETAGKADPETVSQGTGEAKSLFLHSCCAPCSSYVLEYLCCYFYITVFYYNPNISAAEEYRKRVEEQKRLIHTYNAEMEAGTRRGYPIEVVEGDYEPHRFYEAARGYEDRPEGGERCFRCFDLRLRETAGRAREAGADFFCTTLTISPLKDARKLNEIGMALSAEYGVPWLPSDFKKKNGYRRSVELSSEYGLYRQNYCGCGYSLRDAGI